MATVIAKYSDYAINSIEYFIEQLTEEINFRDVAGFTNNRVQLINVTKQHPLVTLMASQLVSNKSLDEVRSSLLPAISVTPGNPVDEGITLGQSLQMEIVDDAFIEILRGFLNKTEKERVEDCLITQNQIELIISEYRKKPAGTVRVQIREWRKNEEINISVWNENPDLDIIMGNVVDSLLADLQVGFVGDDSPIQNMKWKATKGLTNFNFGRVIFGSEYTLTFMNTYNNFTVYSDDVLSGHDFYGTFTTPGE